MSTTHAKIRGRSILSCAALGAALWPTAARAQILQINPDSAVAYQPTVASTVQDIEPIWLQRGTHVDGSARVPMPAGWAIAGNPGAEGMAGARRLGDIDLPTGTFSPTYIDIGLPAPGFSVLIGRTYNGRQEDSVAAHRDSNGYMGKNWAQLAQPAIVLYDADNNPSTKQAADEIQVIYGADRYATYKRSGASSDDFVGKNGAAGVIHFAANGTGEPETYTLTDLHDNQIIFLGFDGDAGSSKGQFWKMTDAAGNATYVGSSTFNSSTATTGYSSGRITALYDSADRRYTFTYSTLDSVNRLTQVKAETKTGGTWSGTPTGVATVATVDYAYYQTGDNTEGDNGNLKLVTTTLPLSPSSTNEVRVQHLRYWKGTYNASTNPGYPNTLKLVLDAEGTRSFDWGESGTESPPVLDSGYLSASTTDLKPYGTYLEYDSSYRVNKVFFNGQCGCSGGADGTHYLTYGENSGQGEGPGSSTYSNAWLYRVVVQAPLQWRTHYFDNVGQPLSIVITAADPATNPSTRWATVVTRTAWDGTNSIGGFLSTISMPDNVTGYTHSSGAFTTSTSAGLVRTWTRKTGSDDLAGFITQRDFKKGTSGTATPESAITYSTTLPSKTVGGVTLKRPEIASTSVYKTDSTYDTTSYTTTSSGIVIQQIDTTLPAVSTVNNGSGSSAVPKQRYNADGTPSFSKSGDGMITYRQYTTGRLTKLIQDADTSQTGSGQDFNGITIPSGFSSSGTPLHIKTTYTYDAQGRPSGSTLPSTRVTTMYYTRLADSRLVTLSIPRVVSGGSTTYYGPVGYTVANQAGRAEAQGIIAVANGGTTTALSSWISTSSADPIAAVSVSGSEVTRLTMNIYAEGGTKLTEARSYFNVPSSGAGTEGTNYDATRYGYDTMGRRRRTKAPDGTITLTVYETRGLPIETWVGTNDADETGTDNVIKVASRQYDGGSSGGNSYITSQTTIVDSTDDGSDPFDDDRVTTFTNDVRGRRIIAANPLAPHILTKYDNIGRVTAVGLYSSTSGLTESSDPTNPSFATNRLALWQTFYDERGQVWKSQRHKIDSGTDSDNLQTLNWYDAEGRLIKTKGPQLAKYFYDRVGRRTSEFILASVDSTESSTNPYSAADDVDSDVVLEEHQTYYQASTGNALMRVDISRHYDDISTGQTTGPLDTDSDLSLVDYSGSKIKGRAQITALFYDGLDRLAATVSYGTNGGSNYDRDSESVSTPPSRSDTAIVTSYAYHEGGTTVDDGLVHDTIDPREVASAPIVTRIKYDDAGRRIATIANYVNGTPSSDTGDDDVYTRYGYTSGHMTSIHVDLNGDGTVNGNDQLTTYTYGVAKGTSTGDSKVAHNGLLQKVTYPDSTAGTDVVTYAYDAQGVEIWRKDQATNVIERNYDTMGRLLHTKGTTIVGGFDSAVARITLVYDTLGRASTVTQFNTTTISSPDTSGIVDQVAYTYDGWGDITKFEQDKDSAVSGGGNDYEVSYTWAKSTAGRNTLYVDDMTLPSGTVLDYQYLSTGGLFDADTARVTKLAISSTVLAEYRYNGVGQLLSTNYPQPDVFTTLDGTTARSYSNIDRFDRVTESLWWKNLATDKKVYSVTIAYDRDGNPISTVDNVQRAVNGGNGRFDVQYTIDGMNRVTRAKEGHLASGAVSDANATRDELWTLSQTGLWNIHKYDADGDLNYNESSLKELSENNPLALSSGYFTAANEWWKRDTDNDGAVNFTLAYDAVGNLTDDGESYKYKYDVFGRLVEIKNQSNALAAEYRYNGLGFLIAEHTDVDGDGDVDSVDPWYYNAYTTRWQKVATFRNGDSSPKAEYIFNNAGLDGRGGSSYVDSVVTRYRDMNVSGGWTGACDGAREEKRYLLQNQRGDVSVVLKDDGKLVEFVKYSSYGVPFLIPCSDVNSDGTVTSQDLFDFLSVQGGSFPYDVRCDMDLDGDVDSADYALWNTEFNAGHNAGRGYLSRADTGNRKGYAGYENGGATAASVNLARYRWMVSGLGRWTTRDRIGYLGGLDLYNYVNNGTLRAIDPLGLVESQGHPKGPPDEDWRFPGWRRWWQDPYDLMLCTPNDCTVCTVPIFSASCCSYFTDISGLHDIVCCQAQGEIHCLYLSGHGTPGVPLYLRPGNDPEGPIVPTMPPTLITKCSKCITSGDCSSLTLEELETCFQLQDIGARVDTVCLLSCYSASGDADLLQCFANCFGKPTIGFESLCWSPWVYWPKKVTCDPILPPPPPDTPAPPSTGPGNEPGWYPHMPPVAGYRRR